jgi:hypothetical protein
MSKLRNFDWRQEAQYLLEVQAKRLWLQNDQATSFSDWLKLRAENDGIKISLLWRYLRVGRFVVELNLGDWEQVASPLGIPEGINADSLELLEKINRVATAEDFKPLAEKLYAKKIKRTQLLIMVPMSGSLEKVRFEPEKAIWALCLAAWGLSPILSAEKAIQKALTLVRTVLAVK